MKMKPEPCNRILSLGHGYRIHCTHIKGCCPLHDRKRPSAPPEPEALTPHEVTTPTPPALSLFEAV
jgi:hypothetical protein